MSFTVKVEVSAGMDFNEAIQEAYGLTQRMNTNVRFMFNELDVQVYRNGNVLVFRKGKPAVNFTINTVPDKVPY